MKLSTLASSSSILFAVFSTSSLLLLPKAAVGSSVRGQNNNLNNHNNNNIEEKEEDHEKVGSLICQLTMTHSFYEKHNHNGKGSDITMDHSEEEGVQTEVETQFHCVDPIMDDLPTVNKHLTIPFLPSDIIQEYHQLHYSRRNNMTIPGGEKILVSITEPSITKDHRVLFKDSSSIQVITDPSRERILTPLRDDKLNLMITGSGPYWGPNPKIFIIRVTTPDSAPTSSEKQLSDHFWNDGDGISVRSQFKQCSLGSNIPEPKWWNDKNTITINLKSPLNTMTSTGSMIFQAERALKDIVGTEYLQYIADIFVYCLPKNDWNRVFIGQVWESEVIKKFGVDNDYCTSLSAMMQYTGFLQGMRWSRGDNSGYMDKIWKAENWPRKCFDGFNSFATSWYTNDYNHWPHIDMPDHIEFMSSEKSTAFKISSFQDARKAPFNFMVAPVLDSKYYFKYNRALGPNSETEAFPNMLTIQETVPNQPFYTELRGALKVGESLILEDRIKVEVCNRISGDGSDTRPDHLVVTIGPKGSSYCPCTSKNELCSLDNECCEPNNYRCLDRASGQKCSWCMKQGEFCKSNSDCCDWSCNMVTKKCW